MKQLIVIRGVPGSGKSTLARAIEADLCAGATNVQILEYDDLRTIDGVYTYDQAENKAIGQQILRDTETYLRLGTTVIVANTFIRRLHIEPYKRMARELRVPYQEYLCLGEFSSVHGCPSNVIAAMRRQLEI